MQCEQDVWIVVESWFMLWMLGSLHACDTAVAMLQSLNRDNRSIYEPNHCCERGNSGKLFSSARTSRIVTHIWTSPCSE